MREHRSNAMAFSSMGHINYLHIFPMIDCHISPRFLRVRNLLQLTDNKTNFGLVGLDSSMSMMLKTESNHFDFHISREKCRHPY